MKFKPKLILAANGIGNPKDIPQRSLEALRTADLLVFEEDRPARQALKAAGIHRDYVKLSEHQQESTLELVKESFYAGKTVCYMSDQGLPTIADPGPLLTEMAFESGAQVEVIPGPSSVSTAVAACPFVTGPFHFAGFLPRDKDSRQKALRQLQHHQCPIVLLDTPYRLKALVDDITSQWPGKCRIFFGFDLTGENERYELGEVSFAQDLIKGIGKKTNFVLILDT